MTVEITNTFAHEVAAHAWSTTTETEWVAETNFINEYGLPVCGYGPTEKGAIQNALWAVEKRL